MFQTELANKNSYMASIGSMRLRLSELYESDQMLQIRANELQEGRENIDGVLHPRNFHKTQKLLAQKYYWASF